MPKIDVKRTPQQQRLFRERGWRIPNIREKYVDKAGKKERHIQCPTCHEWKLVSVVPHMKKAHPEVWAQWVTWFRELHADGMSPKQIMFEFGRAFNWNVIARELIEDEGRLRSITPELVRIDPEPTEFELETRSLWFFKNRGKWGLHDNSYRGNWAPQVPRNLIERYSKPGELVLDPFVGSGTTVLEAVALGRRAQGVDVSARAVKIATHRVTELTTALQKHKRAIPKWQIAIGDARELDLSDGAVDLICAHPPYMDIIEYTRANVRDLSRYGDPSRFLAEFRKVVEEMHRVLKVKGICAVLVGDVRRDGKFIPLGLLTLRALMSAFNVREVVIKSQPATAMGQYWGQKKRSNFFYQIAHEYLFILEKPAADASPPNYLYAL